MYDEAGHFESELSAYDGLVSFVMCENEDEVKRLVLSGDVECGYVLPRKLADTFTDSSSRNLITVYEDGDAVTARIVDETLYGTLFEKEAYSWFAEYMEECEGFEGLTREEVFEALKPHMTGKTTFSLDIRRIGAAENKTDKRERSVTFPVYYTVIAGVLLCALQGMAQALIDAKKNRFYKRNRIIISAITIVQPAMLGVVAGIVTLLLVY